MTDEMDPKIKSLRQLYADSMVEFLKPFPSVRINGLDNFNEMTGGFRTNEFTILCGATGVGKTCFLANIAKCLTEQETPYFVASVETGANDFIKRMLSVYHGKDINRGDPVPPEEIRQLNLKVLEKACRANAWFSLYDDRFSVDTLMSDIKNCVQTKGVKIALVDNINFFLEVTSQQNAIIEMDRVIHQLIIFCKRVNAHIVMVMHPKKTDGGRVESEFDIKGSSTAVQEAHNVFLFNRPHPDLIRRGYADPSDRELKIVKMRRRGKYVGSSLLFSCPDGVSYKEKALIT